MCCGSGARRRPSPIPHLRLLIDLDFVSMHRRLDILGQSSRRRLFAGWLGATIAGTGNKYHAMQPAMPFSSTSCSGLHAFDMEFLLSCMENLKNGKAVDIPNYNFKKYKSVSRARKVNPSDVIILEGILVFHDSHVRDLINMKIFADTGKEKNSHCYSWSTHCNNGRPRLPLSCLMLKYNFGVNHHFKFVCDVL